MAHQLAPVFMVHRVEYVSLIQEHLVPRRDPLSADHCALLLRALGDRDRLRLIQVLRTGPSCVSDLAKTLDLELANVSHHLGVLRRAGLVKNSRHGKQIIYELPDQILQRSFNDADCEHLNLGCCRLEIPGE